MKSLSILVSFALLVTLSACDNNKQSSAQAQRAGAALPENHPDISQQASTQAQANISGSVKETMNTAGYTYIKVDTGTEEVWVAAPEFEVKVGDPVIVGQSLPMPNYHSNTLNRDFDLVYFAGNVAVAGDGMALSGNPAMHDHENCDMDAEGHARPAPVEADIDFSTLKPLEGGKTLAEVFAQRATLVGQEISIRAKVVKYSPNIMKTNWIHLQDGSEGNSDLTVTSAAAAGVGDTVVIKGTLEQNQDFGYGYKYDLIIQDADVTVEK
ncbi:MAG: hypothetical protein PHH87_06825 [Desulfuromonas sp.]|jgi:hypothetical protein|nr:hypothetical protein [Desulfuromonas sp.]